MDLDACKETILESTLSFFNGPGGPIFSASPEWRFMDFTSHFIGYCTVGLRVSWIDKKRGVGLGL